MKLGIRGFKIGKNWSTRLGPLKQTWWDDHESTIALNLWASNGYSLFSNIVPIATFENRCQCSVYFQENKNQWRRWCGGQQWLVLLNLRARPPLTPVFYYIICFPFILTNMHAAQLVEKNAPKPQDLGSSPRSSPPSYYFAFSGSMQVQCKDAPCTHTIKHATRLISSIQGPGFVEYGRL